MKELLLDVGGVGLLCCTSSPALARTLAASYAPFGAKARHHVHLRLVIKDGGGSGPWQEPAVRLHGTGASLSAPGLAAMLDCAAGTGTLHVGGMPAALAVEYALRVACAALATWHGALLVHAAAVLTPHPLTPSPLSRAQSDFGSSPQLPALGRGGRGQGVGGEAAAGRGERGQGERGEATYLFWGPSGAGKTTVAGLSQQAGIGVVLNDDLVLVRRVSGVWRAHGTPFTNPTQTGPGRPGQAPLQAVLHLSKGRDPAVLPLTPPDALARIAVGLPVVMAEPAWAARALAIAMRMVREVPQVELAFRRDQPFWPAIERWAAARGT